MEPPKELSKETYVRAIQENVPLFVDAAEKGLTPPVPSCPGWYVATLVAHLGEVQRFWALQIRERAQEMQQLPQSAFDECPGLSKFFDGVDAGSPDLSSIPPGLIDWYRRSAEQLISAFQGVDPNTAVWHWSGDNRAITHMRNQAIESTVHLWDAQNAHGYTTPVDPELAVDGIEQHFRVQIPAARSWSAYERGQGETFHFHRTDGPGEWLVRFEGESADISHEHAKADIAVRGTAQEIFLWLWNRVGTDHLEVLGDASMLERYRKLVPASS